MLVRLGLRKVRSEGRTAKERRPIMANKSAIVSGAGLVTSFVTNLMNAVWRAGGTDEDIHHLADPEKSRDTWDQIAKLIIEARPAAQAIYKVTVDYGKTLGEMIGACRLDWVNRDLTQEHFPITGEGVQEVEVILFHFNRAMRSYRVLAEIKKQGYRPATLPELLALGASQPELQRQFPIVCLGSAWWSPCGDRGVPCLGWDSSGRCLNLSWFDDYDWDGYCRFLAVRNAS